MDGHRTGFCVRHPFPFVAFGLGELVPKAGRSHAPAHADPETRLQWALDRLGPEWDEQRLEHTPSDDETLHEVLSSLPRETEPKPKLRPTGGWAAFLVPLVSTALMIVAVILMGANLISATTGSFLLAGGFLLLVLAALGRGRRVEATRRRRSAEETLLLFDLEPPVDRETFWAQVELVRDAKQALGEARWEREDRER